MASNNRVHDRMQQLLATSDEPLSVIAVSARLVAVQRAARCDARQFSVQHERPLPTHVHLSAIFAARL